MPLTQVNTGQIFDGGVQRLDLCTTVAGKSVIAKAIQGTAIKITATGADAGTGDATISLDGTVDLGLSALQNITVIDATTTTVTNLLTLNHNSSGTPGIGFGTGLAFTGETDTTISQPMGYLQCAWSTVTHASRTAYMDFLLESSGGLGPTTKMRLFGSGALSVGTTTDPNSNGVINAFTGFRVSNAAPSGQVLRGNGTNFTAATLAFSDLTGSATTAQLPLSSDFGFTTAQTMALTNTNTGSDDTVLRLKHNLSSGTPAGGMGTTIWFSCQSNNVQDRDQGQLYTAWSVATDASRASYMGFRTVTAATMTEQMRLWGSGGLHVGSSGIGTDPGSGFIEASTGFKINGTNIFPVTTANAGCPSAGTAGQLLAKNTGTNYDYGWKTPASVQTTGVNTAGTTSTSGVMAGLAASITPAVSGRLLVIVSGYMQNSLAGQYTIVGTGVRYGTGTAPAHGAAPTGTNATGSAGAGTSSTANYFLPFSISSVITGLTVGTTYWLDVSYASQSASGTAKLFLAAISAHEF